MYLLMCILCPYLSLYITLLNRLLFFYLKIITRTKYMMYRVYDDMKYLITVLGRQLKRSNSQICSLVPHASPSSKPLGWPWWSPTPLSLYNEAPLDVHSIFRPGWPSVAVCRVQTSYDLEWRREQTTQLCMDSLSGNKNTHKTVQSFLYAQLHFRMLNS